MQKHFNRWACYRQKLLNAEVGKYGKELYYDVLDYRMLVSDSLAKMKSYNDKILYVLGTLDDLTDAVPSDLDDLIVMIQYAGI